MQTYALLLESGEIHALFQLLVVLSCVAHSAGDVGWKKKQSPHSGPGGG